MIVHCITDLAMCIICFDSGILVHNLDSGRIDGRFWRAAVCRGAQSDYIVTGDCVTGDQPLAECRVPGEEP